MGWKRKLVVDNLKQLLPCKQFLRRQKRRLFPFREREGTLELTLRHALQQLEYLGNLGFQIADCVALEVGCGWNPILPLSLVAADCGRIHVVDTERLMDRDTLLTSLGLVLQSADRIAEIIGHDVRQVRSRLQVGVGETFDGMLERLRLNYIAPCDAASLPLESESVDFVYSRTVFEHVPATVLRGILADARRVLKPGGLSYHLIDHSDHWSHTDKSLTAVNFLRYPDWVWPLFCFNVQNYQNRLRHSQYLKMFEDVGFQFVSEHCIVHDSSLESLNLLPLARRFQGMDRNDLATTASTIVVRS